MRTPTVPLALLALVAGGCIVVERPAPAATTVYRPATAGAPVPAGSPAPASQLTREDAIQRAFDYARDRGLEVDRVHEAQLDGRGRWRVDVRGPGDRARMLLDARDGRLLKGRFRESDPELED